MDPMGRGVEGLKEPILIMDGDKYADKNIL
jgi:hypothetical protein